MSGTGLMLCFLTLLIGASSALGGSSPTTGPMTYDEAVARGLPVPTLVPGLPICRFDEPDPGFRTAAEMEAEVRNEEEAVCQRDPREGSYMIKPARDAGRLGR